jgi:hypothetical protein
LRQETLARDVSIRQAPLVKNFREVRVESDKIPASATWLLHLIPYVQCYIVD